MKPDWPNEICPANPIRILRPMHAMMVIRMVIITVAICALAKRGMTARNTIAAMNQIQCILLLKIALSCSYLSLETPQGNSIVFLNPLYFLVAVESIGPEHQDKQQNN